MGTIKLFDKVIKILEERLTSVEFQALCNLLDNGCGDELLDGINERLMQTNPELFVDTNNCDYVKDGIAHNIVGAGSCCQDYKD